MEKMEQKVLREFMILYREHVSLWDTTHKLYSNKIARERAYDILLKKFRELNPVAEKTKMKKKIENLRTTYKRERTKVRKAKLAGELHEPTLWYYSLMSFLDEHDDNTKPEQQIVTIIDEGDNDDDDDNEDEDEVFSMECTESPSPPPTKIAKTASIYLNESNDNDYVIEPVKNSTPSKKIKRARSQEHVYVEEKDNLYQEEPSCSVKNEPSEVYLRAPTAETDLYSKTISSQLKELRPMQRFIAEKLISEIIFFGRLDKLKTGTSLNLNTDI